MTLSLSDLKLDVEQTRQSLNSLQENQNQQVKQLKDDVASLTTSVSQTDAKINGIEETMGQGEVMIVSGEGTAGDAICMKVCAGSTGRTTTDWHDYGNDGLYYNVDISGCGFITVPTVTTSIEGTGYLYKILGTASIYNSTPTSFRIQVYYSGDPQGGFAESMKWNVEWIAVGYTC